MREQQLALFYKSGVKPNFCSQVQQHSATLRITT